RRLRRDRRDWKQYSILKKLGLAVAAPIALPLLEAYKSARGFYKWMAGDNPTTAQKSASVLATVLSLPFTLAWGGMKGLGRGLAYGLGNPLYSAGEEIQELRGIYKGDPTGKYGNLPDPQRAAGKPRENYGVDTISDIGNYALLATSAGASGSSFTSENI